MMNDDFKVSQWNVWGLRDINRCRTIRSWIGGLRTNLNVLCLRELQTDEVRATFQLGQVFPQGLFLLDIVENGRVGAALALPVGHPALEQGCKGDISLAWMKTQTCKGEIYVALIYGDRKRKKRVDLWKWMEINLPVGNWLICGDFNHIEYVDD